MEMLEMILDKVVFGLVAGGSDPNEVPASVWDRLSEKPELSTEFMREFHDYLNWDKISVYHKDFTEKDCDIIHEYLNWELVTKHRLLPEKVLTKYYVPGC